MEKLELTRLVGSDKSKTRSTACWEGGYFSQNISPNFARDKQKTKA